jgi:hypothetical protein
VTAAEAALARLERLGRSKLVSREELDAAQTAVTNAKAKLAAVEAEAPYLVGKQPQVGAGRKITEAEPEYREALRLYISALESRHHTLSGRLTFTDAAVRGPTADKIRKALDRPVTLRVTDAPPDEAVRMLRQSSPDLPIHFVKGAGAPAKLTMDLREVALGAALEWLEDSLPGYRAVVREYGILITQQDRVPPEAAFLHDFWKGKREDKDTHPPTGAGAKNPPPEQVEGLIKGVDGEGLVKDSLGSDAGLAKGHTLEVFRLKPKPVYVGTIRILEVTATEAVGRSVGRMRTPPQEGDHVISTVRGS